MAIHPSVGRVSRVYCTVERAGRNAGHFTCDLIWVAGVPAVVFDWIEYPDGDRPGAITPLDPARLRHEEWRGCEYYYEDPVPDPRTLS